MPTAVICDDEPEINRSLCRMAEKILPGWEIICCFSGEELLGLEKAPELVLLDVKMGGADGIETARRLRETEKGLDTEIVFVSGAKEPVFSAFDVGAFNYLLKPVSEERLGEVLTRAAEKIAQKPKKAGGRLLVKIKGKSRAIEADDILYLENDMRKIAVHTRTETIAFYGVMNKLEEQLGQDFFRCHRGYLVNLAFVSGYDNSSVYLVGGEKVYMSKEKYPTFVKRYMRFLRGRKENV